MKTKQELLRSTLKRYLKASKERKTKILDELSVTLGLHRKATIRALKREQMRDPHKPPKKRGRKTTYGPGVTAALKTMWELSRELCAERLKPAIPDYLMPLQRDGMWKYSSLL